MSETQATHPRCYFAFRSPYSRLGLHKLMGAEVPVTLIPFTGPPQGVPFQDPTANPLKSAYYAEDVVRLCIRMDLPIMLPDTFDVDFGPATRAFVAADREGAGLAFAVAVSDARWGAGKDISDIALLAEMLDGTGLSPSLAEAAQADPSIDAVLQAHRDAIEADGVFGVPFVVWDGRKYWGQDRIDLFLEEYEPGSETLTNSP